jgi:hypothetical protein
VMVHPQKRHAAFSGSTCPPSSVFVEPARHTATFRPPEICSIHIICTTSTIRICGLGGAGNHASQQGIWLPLVGWCELYTCTQQQLRGGIGDDHDRSPPNASCLVAPLVATGTPVEVLCLSSLWNGQSGCHLFLP